MNQSLSALIPIPIGNTSGLSFNGLGASKVPSSIETGLFSVQLAQQLTTLNKPNVTVVNSPTPKPATTDNSALAKLQKNILDQLHAGASAADVANRLATSLASSVAQQLGVTTDNARMQLQTAFASALAPPGQTGPPVSTADIARTLAQQFAQVADAATRVASSGESGQLNRFVGNILDADTAKETLAPPTTPTASGTPTATGTTATPAAGSDSAARDASDSDKVTRALVAFQAQLTSAAPPSSPPSLTNPVTIAAAAASDGRVVQLAPAQAIATAGDTPLGRILARAAQAANITSGTAAAESDATPASTVSLVAQPSVAQSATDAAVTTFLQSFASANATLAGSNDPASKARDDETSALLLPSNGSTDAPSFVPVAPPFTIDTSQQTAPAVSAPPSPPPAATDANAIVGQVLQGAFLKNLGQSSEIRMQLVPEHLGEVNIKLTVTGDNVSAHVIAQTSDVHDALVAGQSQLTKSLSDAGLKLTSFNVDVANNGFAGFAQQQQSQSQQRPSGGQRTLLGSDADDSGSDTTLQAIPSFGPPLLANQDFGSLNYLV